MRSTVGLVCPVQNFDTHLVWTEQRKEEKRMKLAYPFESK